MAGKSTQAASPAKAAAGQEGKAAPAAAGSSPAKKTPVASEVATREGAQSGKPIDAELQADIFRQLGGKPDPVESDTDEAEDEGETEVEAESGASAAAADNEESAGDEDAETEEDAEEGATETETEAEAEAEAGEEPAADDDEAEGATPKWAEKRFGELTREIRERDRKIAELEARVNPATAAVAPRPAPLGLEADLLQASTPQELAQARERFEQLEDLAVANPDGLEIPARREGEQPTVYTREQMATLRMNARRALRLLPERERQIAVSQQYESAAHEIYPGFNDPESDEGRSVSFMLRTVPEIRRYPAWKQLIGDAIVGEKLRKEKAKLAAAVKKGGDGKPLAGKPVVKAAEQRRPAPLSGAPKRAAVTATPKAARLAEARKRVNRSGSEANVAGLLELILPG